MAHKTLIGGTAYNVTGGKSMVSGTAYNISGGKTLVGGTSYNINLKSDESAYAMLYSDGNFVFQYGNKVASGKTLTASYTGFDNTTYANFATVPWNSKAANIKKVYFNNKISPIAIYGWCHGAVNLTSFNTTNLDMTNVVNMRAAFFNCSKLTGSSFCGPNVDNFSDAFYNCKNITGVCACGPNVTNMSYAYYGCEKTNGGTVGNNVTNMAYAFYNCKNFSQVPVIGSNVVNMAYAYCNAFSAKTGNIYIFSPNITNVCNCLYRTSIAGKINVYVLANSTTNKTIHCNNSLSVSGSSMYWTNGSGYKYSKNIYIYPLASVDAIRNKMVNDPNYKP